MYNSDEKSLNREKTLALIKRTKGYIVQIPEGGEILNHLGNHVGYVNNKIFYTLRKNKDIDIEGRTELKWEKAVLSIYALKLKKKYIKHKIRNSKNCNTKYCKCAKPDFNKENICKNCNKPNADYNYLKPE